MEVKFYDIVKKKKLREFVIDGKAKVKEWI